ncbi:MAG: DUF4388 domain-containing protein [Deltaproteobacteria bacterium]|nr:DUF4388 domain-containing protein [Deltaproteobacteria bacterium]
MAIYGSLRTMPLADLMQWVKTTSRSGVLTVSRDGNEWELVLNGGTVATYSGPELHDNLGHIVVTSALLSEEDLRTAIQHQRAVGGSLQQAMLSRGLIAQEPLQQCLRELAIESIYDLFIDLPGEFVFSEINAKGFDLGLDDQERLSVDLDVNHLLMEGARRQDEWLHVRERFPHDDVRIRIIDEKLPPLETIGVRERRILASISAGQSVSDICLELRAPILSVLRTLVSFEAMGAVVFLPDENADTHHSDSGRLEQLMDQVEVLRQSRQFDEAVSLLEVVVRMRPDSENARIALKESLEEQIKDLYSTLPPLKVPVIIADEHRLGRLRLRPDERFLLNRLSAQMDIGSLIMVSSLNERETLKTLKKLLHSGIIELK